MNYFKNPRFLSVAAFSCFFAYILSFLFEGKVLYSILEYFNVNSDSYILVAVVAHFLGLFSCGFLIYTQKSAKIFMLVSGFVCFIFTIPFFCKFSLLWYISIAVSGYAAGWGVASWGYFLKIYTPKKERLKTCADVLIFSNILMIVINVVALHISTFLGLLISMICIILSLVFVFLLPAEESLYKSEKNIPANLRKPMSVLFLFVTVITINSGMMYQVINPAFESLSGLVSWYWAVPYIVSMVIMRNLPKRFKRSSILYFGIAMIMAAFVCFMLLGRESFDYLVVDTLMLGACGIFDLFWWSIIGEMLDYSTNPVKVFGIGISANVFGVLLGDILGICITSITLPSAEVVVIALCIVCVTLVILPPLNMQLLVLLKSHVYLAAYSGMTQKEQNSIIKEVKMIEPLTPREEEVLQLILSGKTNRVIAQELKISENTVKTHASNIYAKYGVSSRAELISTILKKHTDN